MSSMSLRKSSTSQFGKDDPEGKKIDLKCGTCAKSLKDADKVLMCKSCDRFFHIQCQKVDDAKYQVLIADEASNSPCMLWFCNSNCNLFAKKIITGMTEMRREIESIKADVSRVSTSVDNIDVRVADMESGVLPEGLTDSVRRVAKEEIQSVDAERLTEREQITEEVFSEAVSTAVKEMKERQQRKKSIIIHNIPMSKSADMNVRISHDKKCFEKLCVKGLGFKKTVNTRRITRLGKKEDKSRPMKVTFDDSNVVNEIFKATPNLEGKDLFKDISIASDRTPLERQERKKLMKLKEERQAMSDQMGDGVKWKIIGDRVVKDRQQSQISLKDTGASPENEGLDTWG